MRRALAILAILAATVGGAAPAALAAPPGAPATADCTFANGFKALHDAIPAIVGECRDNEHPDDQGNTVQETTRGVLLYRPNLNANFFTDGWNTYVLGPCGLQHRTNDRTFPWERGEGGCGDAGPQPQPQPAAQYPAWLAQRLRPAWDAMRAVHIPSTLHPEGTPLSDVVAGWLDGTGALVEVGDLPGAWGMFSGRTGKVTISSAAAADAPEAAAAVLVHEAKHVAQEVLGNDTDCVHREVDAMMQESFAWSYLRDGKDFAPSDLVIQEEVQLAVLADSGEAGMYRWVVEDTNYQRECRLWQPG